MYIYIYIYIYLLKPPHDAQAVKVDVGPAQPRGPRGQTPRSTDPRQQVHGHHAALHQAAQGVGGRHQVLHPDFVDGVHPGGLRMGYGRVVGVCVVNGTGGVRLVNLAHRAHAGCVRMEKDATNATSRGVMRHHTMWRE